MPEDAATEPEGTDGSPESDVEVGQTELAQQLQGTEDRLMADSNRDSPKQDASASLAFALLGLVAVAAWRRRV
jgi:MYXO-CTERM domain-containing protein